MSSRLRPHPTSVWSGLAGKRPLFVVAWASRSTLNRAFFLPQYFGYLRRNPNDAPESSLDYTGYDFWLTKLNQFYGDFVRADMVKAFLLSGEYRRRVGL